MSDIEATTVEWTGAESLAQYLVPIDSLEETAGNPFKGEAHVAELMGSLRRFGQVRPILLDLEDGKTIRAGHHLRRAAAELGWTHIAAMPSKFGSYEEALAYVAADNRLTEIGERDPHQQLDFLSGLDQSNLEGTGWTIDAYETLRATFDAVPEIPQVEPWAGGHAETPEEAAARAASIAAQVQHKEVVLMLTMPEYEKFQTQIKGLAKHWGTSGAKETFLQAVDEAHDQNIGPYEEPKVGEATDEPREAIEAPAALPGAPTTGVMGESTVEITTNTGAPADDDAFPLGTA